MRKNVVQMKQIVEKMNLKNLTPDVELSDKAVVVNSKYIEYQKSLLYSFH